MDALDAHGAMSKQALNSPTVREGMKDILLNYGGGLEGARQRRGAHIGEQAGLTLLTIAQGRHQESPIKKALNRR